MLKDKQLIRGFTIVEILVVVSVIAILVALLMVAVQSGRGAAKSIRTSANLKQISEWMQLWSGDNQNNILPSQFDYVDEAEAGDNVYARMDEHAADDNAYDDITRLQYQGTWADLLWSYNNLHIEFGLNDFEEEEAGRLRWKSNSPDNDVYTVYESFDHPFRSALNNTRGPEMGLPGYFAANDFFDSRSDNDTDGDTDSRIDRYFTYSMIKSPSQSIYLIDSVAGETIGDEPEPWLYDFDHTSEGQIIAPTVDTDGEVDFRNGGECNVLLLDGSITSLLPWTERGPEAAPGGGADTSLYGMGYRVHQLTLRRPTP